MQKFYVLYYEEDIGSSVSPPLAFECQAEDGDHAEEQCINAWPDCKVVWVSEEEDVKMAYNDYWFAGDPL